MDAFSSCPTPDKVSIELGLSICWKIGLMVTLHLLNYYNYWEYQNGLYYQNTNKFNIFCIFPCHFFVKLTICLFINNIVFIKMQGGLFGLNKVQQVYLYICQIMPTLIALYEPDLIFTMLFVEIFYLVSSWFYVRFISIQKSWYPYIINELIKLKYQLHKGFVLGISAFLLITVYGVIFIKIGRVALPSQIHLGESFNDYWWVFAILSFLNPFIEEWFWRLFLPKTFDSTYYKSHMMNISYLLFHLVLFSRYVGFFRAVPLVGTFFSVGRSMSHIKSKYGILSSVVAHYGITFGSFTLYIYLNLTTQIFK